VQLNDKTLPDNKFFTVNDDLITVVQNINWWIFFGVLEITKKIPGVVLFPLENKEFFIQKCFAF
jgi:hypothetical protein